MMLHTLAIIGVGLMGGSVGLAAKKRRVAERVVGVGRPGDALEQARRLGAIDDAAASLADAARAAQLIVVATPVSAIVTTVREAATHSAPGTLLTDVGSTKGEIVQALELTPAAPRYAGSHPLAGSERHGVDHADGDLFEDRVTVVTQTRRTDADVVQRLAQFWTSLGSRVRILSPSDHDAVLARTSHLPHLIAAALAAGLDPEQYELTASGFRDTTRIAAGDPGLWTEIVLQNRGAVLAALDAFQNRLEPLRRALDNRDAAAIHAFLTQAKKVRDALGTPPLPP
jgi:prephenate dehydrogenase